MPAALTAQYYTNFVIVRDSPNEKIHPSFFWILYSTITVRNITHRAKARLTSAFGFLERMKTIR
jgi:hypothetical protein